MTTSDFAVAAPEIVLLAAACVVLVVDLFVSDAKRNITYGLTMLALVAVAVTVVIPSGAQ